jgi:hypothetical protein
MQRHKSRRRIRHSLFTTIPAKSSGSKGDSMLTRLDKIVIGLIAVALVPSLAFLVGVEAPMLSRCTEAALDILEKADPQNRKPPATLINAIMDENWHPDFAYATARHTIRSSECMGPPSYSLGWRVQYLPLGLWWRLRFSEEDLKAIYVAQMYLGNRTYGFAAGARYYFGRELNELSADEQRCLARRVRAPSNFPRYACNGK